MVSRVSNNTWSCLGHGLLLFSLCLSCNLPVCGQTFTPHKQDLLKRKSELLQEIQTLEQEKGKAQSTRAQAESLRDMAKAENQIEQANIYGQAVGVAQKAVAAADRRLAGDRGELDSINRQLSTVAAQSVQVISIVRAHRSELETVSVRIEKTQVSLRQLIRRASLDSSQQQDWEKEVEGAANDAKVLSLNLTLDLLQAHLAHQLGGAAKELGANVDAISGATNATRREQLHNAFLVLRDRRDELQRIERERKLADNEEFIREKIEVLESKHAESTPELLYDVAKLVGADEVVGPGKDLVDSAYTMSQEAVGLWQLAKLPDRSKEYLATSTRLSKQIQKLVAQEQAANKSATDQPEQ